MVLLVFWDVVLLSHLIKERDVQTLTEGDPYCSVLNKMTGATKISKLKGSEAAIVDYVAAVSTGSKDPLQKVSVKGPKLVSTDFTRRWF